LATNWRRIGDEALPVKIAWLDHVLAAYGERPHEFIVVNDRGVRRGVRVRRQRTE
jgi:hypothetical protein